MRHQVLPEEGADANSVTADNPRAFPDSTPIEVDSIGGNGVAAADSELILGSFGSLNDMVRGIIHDGEAIVEEDNCRLLKGMRAQETT